MAGYVEWLAPQMDNLPAHLRQTFSGARDRVTNYDGHLRVPEILAHLWVGFQCAMVYAEEVRAIEASETGRLREEFWTTLLALGREQGELLVEERPTHRFLRVLMALLTSGKAHLRSKEGGDQVQPGELLGWLDEEAVLLIPEASFLAVARFCRDTGEAFAVREYRLREDLLREKLAFADKGRRTTTVKIEGGVRRVLGLHRAAIEELLGEEFRSPVQSPEDHH
jgi:hypothetical protein